MVAAAGYHASAGAPLMLLLDTSGLLAGLFPDQAQHLACAAVLREEAGPLVLSPFVLAEVDYLISRLAGETAARTFLDEVATGAYELAPFSAADVAEANAVLGKYAGSAFGLADASIVVLARRLNCRRVLTLDLRHFRALRGADRRAFRLLPADR